MGSSMYSSDDRYERSMRLGYETKSTDKIFTQSTERKSHDSMRPLGVKMREARDSDNHPHSTPIILGLDVTGSMMEIPKFLVRQGLPKIMGGIIQKGSADPALLFVALGDHEKDTYPLQIGQFESGDEELDTWLTRTYLEGGGGSNTGESYLLAWYFAAFHTVTDAWEKRGEKGILITIGDEPGLKTLPMNALKGIMGDVAVGQDVYSDRELLAAAQEKWDVYHIVVLHTSGAYHSLPYWKDLLGQNCIEVKAATDVADVITTLVTERKGKVVVNTPSEPIQTKTESTNDEELLL